MWSVLCIVHMIHRLVQCWVWSNVLKLVKRLTLKLFTCYDDSVWKWRPWKIRTLKSDSAIKLWIILFRAYTAHLLVFCVAQSPWFPKFYLLPCCLLRGGNDPLYVSLVLLILLSHRERTLAGWQLAPPLSPMICSHLLYGVSQPQPQPVWTLTGYFGLKFQHPSVKPNKRHLKGRQKPREKQR